ncbi:tetratricopeptide repeat protein, partial [Deinococcus pimensis]|uniref:tetratricopeptide repeat protein n=1 Tax=Deinococcus pimensis TaxID=309888 RepID=UPI00047F6793
MAHKPSRMTLSVLACAGLLGGPAHAQGASVTTATVQTSTPDLAGARAALAAKDYATARTLFETALTKGYEDPDAHFGLGLALYGLGDLPGAKFEFEQLVRLSPDRYEGHYNLGVVATRARRFDDALAEYRKALEAARASKAGDAAVLTVLGALTTELTRRGDDAELVKTLTDVLALRPSDTDTRLRLAEAFVRAGRGTEALPYAYSVLKDRPASVRAGLLIANVYAAQGLGER